LKKICQNLKIENYAKTMMMIMRFMEYASKLLVTTNVSESFTKAPLHTHLNFGRLWNFFNIFSGENGQKSPRWTVIKKSGFTVALVKHFWYDVFLQILCYTDFRGLRLSSIAETVDATTQLCLGAVHKGCLAALW
jgi:hypothetical protein